MRITDFALNKYFLIICFCFNQIFALNAQCPDGYVNLDKQSEIDNFILEYPNCTEVNGNLFIEWSFNSDIQNLEGLRNIRKVTGNLILEVEADFSALRIDSVMGSVRLLYKASSIPGFTTLKYIGEDLVINTYKADSIGPGLENIKVIHGNLEVHVAPGLTNLKGLESLEGIEGDLILLTNIHLKNLEGLSALRYVKGDVKVSENKEMINFQGLSNLETIGGELRLSKNALLSNFEGLGNLKRLSRLAMYNGSGAKNFEGLHSLDTITHKLALFTADSLVNFTGLSNLKFVDTVDIHDCRKLVSMKGFNEQHMDISRIVLQGNPKIFNLDGLQGLRDIKQGFYVYGSPGLVSTSGLILSDTVLGSIEISGCPLLSDISSLQSIKFIENEFYFWNCKGIIELPPLQLRHAGLLALGQLNALPSLAGLDSLQTVGSFILSALDSIEDLGALKSLKSIDHLNLNAMDHLSDITGLSTVVFTKDVKITNCPLLSVCNIESFCERLIEQPSSFTIEDNAPGCNSIQEISMGCDQLFSTFEVFYDPNKNGIIDFNERGIELGSFIIDGLYTLVPVQQGLVVIANPATGMKDVVFEIPHGWTITTPQTHFQVHEDDAPQFYRIGISPDTVYEKIDYTGTSTRIRCNEEATFYLSVQNTGTSIVSPKICFNYMGELNTAFDHDSIGPGTICNENWVLAQLFPGDKRVLTAVIKLPGVEFIGDTLLFSINLSGADDSLAYHYDPVLECGFDPNDKLANPGASSDNAFISANTSIDYTIRFQNTGNSWAEDILLIDTISTLLDISSFRFLGSSHSISQIEIQEQVIKFSLLGIYLPDSTTDLQGSQGLVQFKINQQPDLVSGQEITNGAAIYFDQNPPVLTNRVKRIIPFPNTSTEKVKGDISEFIVFPNPASNVIYFPASFSGMKFHVYNSYGLVAMTGEVVENEMETDDLSAGFYFIVMSSGDRMWRSRFIKL